MITNIADLFNLADASEACTPPCFPARLRFLGILSRLCHKAVRPSSASLWLILLLVFPPLASAQLSIVTPQGGYIEVIFSDLPEEIPAYCGARNGNIDAGACSPASADITLTPFANFPSQFLRWSGDCEGTGKIDIKATSLSTPKSCTALFITLPLTQVAGGHEHQCVLIADGRIGCWGNGGDGRLGDGQSTTATNPVAAQGISTALAVSAGQNHTCALLTDRTVKCWGGNADGQLGTGNNTPSTTAVVVTDLSDVAAIAAKSLHSCAQFNNGSVRCWGNNSNGQLGNNSTNDSNTPVSVDGIVAIAIATGAHHTCAVLQGGSVRCWGGNSHGQLGSGTVGSNSLTPAAAVLGITNATTIAAGSAHTCVLLQNQRIQCWGSNNNSQLGNSGTSAMSLTLVNVMNLSTAIAVSAGANHSCALSINGATHCWGSNSNGQLGNGTSDSSSTPVAVQGISTAIDMTASAGNKSCAVLVNGVVYCWGAGYTNVATAVPNQPSPIAPSSDLTVFYGHSLTAYLPYRAIATTLSGTLPDWLTYSETTGVLTGTPPSSSQGARITITPDSAMPIQVPPTIITLIPRVVPTRITIEDLVPIPNTIARDAPIGSVVGTIRFVAEDQNNDEIPVNWILSVISFDKDGNIGTDDPSILSIDATTGIIRKIGPRNLNKDFVFAIRAGFPTSAQRNLQLSLVSLAANLPALSILETDPSSPIEVHLKVFLEGPLQ